MSADLIAGYRARQLELSLNIEYAHSLWLADHAAHVRVAALRRWRGTMVAG